MKLTSSITPQESHRLKALVKELGLPLKMLPEILSLGREDSLTWWSHNDASFRIPHSTFSRLTDLTGINEDHLFSGEYSKDLARRRILGDHTSLPDRYLENKNSFVRTSDHIIRYIALTRGQWFADQVLTKLHVSPLIYKDLNTQINLTYFADLLKTLGNMGFSQIELDTLASVNFLTLHETELGKQFQQSGNYFDVYKTLAGNFQQFDSNFEYKSDFRGKKYYLKTTIALRDHSFLKNDLESMTRLLRYRQILLAWFPYLAGMAPLFPQTDQLIRSDYLEVQYEIKLDIETRPPLGLRVV